MAIPGSWGFIHGNDVKGVNMQRVAIFIYHHDDTRSNSNEFRVRHSDGPTIGEAKDEWPKAASQALHQEVHIHSRLNWFRGRIASRLIWSRSTGPARETVKTVEDTILKVAHPAKAGC